MFRREDQIPSDKPFYVPQKTKRLGQPPAPHLIGEDEYKFSSEKYEFTRQKAEQNKAAAAARKREIKTAQKEAEKKAAAQKALVNPEDIVIKPAKTFEEFQANRPLVAA